MVQETMLRSPRLATIHHAKGAALAALGGDQEGWMWPAMRQWDPECRGNAKRQTTHIFQQSCWVALLCFSVLCTPFLTPQNKMTADNTGNTKHVLFKHLLYARHYRK